MERMNSAVVFCITFLLICFSHSIYNGIVCLNRQRRFNARFAELDRYVLEMERALEKGDLEAFERWRQRTDELIEHTKKELGQ